LAESGVYTTGAIKVAAVQNATTPSSITFSNPSDNTNAKTRTYTASF
jgi:hypothetical protein